MFVLQILPPSPLLSPSSFPFLSFFHGPLSVSPFDYLPIYLKQCKSTHWMMKLFHKVSLSIFRAIFDARPIVRIKIVSSVTAFRPLSLTVMLFWPILKVLVIVDVKLVFKKSICGPNTISLCLMRITMCLVLKLFNDKFYKVFEAYWGSCLSLLSVFTLSFALLFLHYS